MGGSRIAVLAVVVLLLVAAGTVPVIAATDGNHERRSGDQPERGTVPSTGAVNTSCFGDGGHQFEIGTEGPRIYLTLHFTLVSNPLSNGSFGVELVGVALDSRIVTLAAGVRHRMPGRPAGVLSNPFAGFTYVFEYRLQLPMFASVEGSDYESEPPVSGPVNGTTC
jgi:hypothetical protein